MLVSNQTKEQAIGYILKASIDTGSNTKDLKDLYYKLNQAIKNNHDISLNNHTTHDLMVLVNRESEVEETVIASIGNNLYYAYDMYTVEEAGDFYTAFKKILNFH